MSQSTKTDTSALWLAVWLALFLSTCGRPQSQTVNVIELKNRVSTQESKVRLLERELDRLERQRKATGPSA